MVDDNSHRHTLGHTGKLKDRQMPYDFQKLEVCTHTHIHTHTDGEYLNV